MWFATEMKGNMSDQYATNTVYISSNFSYDPIASEAQARKENAAISTSQTW